MGVTVVVMGRNDEGWYGYRREWFGEEKGEVQGLYRQMEMVNIQSREHLLTVQ